MRNFKNGNLNDRRSDAVKGKQAMLERVRAMPGADDPVFQAKLAAKQAIAAEREIRHAERKAAKERAAREQELRELELKAEQEAQALREAQEQAERQAALLAQEKAARDARYANRKKRKS